MNKNNQNTSSNIKNNINLAKEEFRENSFVFKFEPYLLKRFDSYNYAITLIKVNKNTNEDYESVLGYYSSLHNALVSLFKRLFKKYPRKEAFIKYFFYKAPLGTKDLIKEVQNEFNKEVKLSKTKGYMFYNTYVTKVDALKMGAIKVN